MTGDQVPEAPRLLHGVLLAVFNEDQAGLDVLLEDVPREILAGLVGSLAAVALAGWERVAGDPDTIRFVIEQLALDLAAGGGS